MSSLPKWYSLFGLLMALAPASLVAETPELPARLPGLVTSFTTHDSAAARRVDLTLNYKWSSANELDERIGPMISADIHSKGFLETKSPGRYQLHVYVQGNATLTLNGETVVSGSSPTGKWFASKAIELPFGFHSLKVQYKATGNAGQIGLYWQGPRFELEPISERYLSHASGESPNDNFDRGRLLAHALRCAACHQAPNEREALPAPSIVALDGNLNRDWLLNWLTSSTTGGRDSNTSTVPADEADTALGDDRIARRMPHFGLEEQAAADIAEALWAASKPIDKQPEKNKQAKSSPRGTDKQETQSAKGKEKQPARTQPSPEEGKTAFNTRGCLACHTLVDLGIGQVDADDDASYLPHQRLMQLSRQLFDGGDLSAVASKRPDHFFARWLSDPERINKQHRMPHADLNELERADVSLYLASLVGKKPRSETESRQQRKDPVQGNAERGKTLLAAHRCGACHELPANLSKPKFAKRALTADSRWDSGCLAKPEVASLLPGFGLTEGQRRALKNYWTTIAGAGAAKDVASDKQSLHTSPDLLLAEKNCVACHARGAGQGLAPGAAQLVDVERDLAARLPAFLPPSLTGVGDKLHDHALRAAIERKEEPRRPWLEVRMPKYKLEENERDALIQHLIDEDRIPERDEAASAGLADDVVTRAAAGRLVTSEGFGCQSCHQIGNQAPPTVALNARGTDLTMLGERIRHSWFDRWVRNPVRIVPRMEMPAIQLPVHGVLDSDLNRQIDAVWEMLNTKGFQPPSPAPVRVVRGHNLPGKAESAHVLTDVLEASDSNYLRPLIFGFQNRHNVLFDLERGAFAKWWIGDTARELTRGKSWYWELGGQPLAAHAQSLARLALVDSNGEVWPATAAEQFAVDFDSLEHTTSGVIWSGRMMFASRSERTSVPITMRLEPLQVAAAGETGVTIEISAALPSGSGLIVDIDALGAELQPVAREPATWSAAIDARSQLILHTDADAGKLTSNRQLMARSVKPDGTATIAMRWVTTWTVDQVAESTSRSAVAQPKADADPPEAIEATVLKIVPGFDALRLPLPRDEMPTALAWYRDQLVVASLKGRVCIAEDRNRDGLADRWLPLSDDMPAPYGLAAHEHGIDVLVKYGLMRLSEPEQTGVPWKVRTLADGWGYTADYHDWAVGLPIDKQNNYYIALPCQQDDRTPSAARLRGTIQKLIPQTPTSENPRAYRLETFAAGQRFPMGLAFDRSGRLFATDNQGNYNPFNELNHIEDGKRYGFINKLDVKPGFTNPPFESPAVNLPHPWTRSVNGICFLDTPETAGAREHFGPFEGHLIGCEYNGLSLIRMSLESVEGVLQGAAYPFSRPPQDGEETFEGPVVCAVSPNGDLYVGNIHDSGWGGGQNTGSMVRLTPNGDWPLGIGTLNATPRGLRISFTGKIDRAAASQTDNYSLRSYRRVSTPAYGGNDQDERVEKIAHVHISPGDTSVELELNELREDAVYELRIGNVGGLGAVLFPSEAHYTMKRRPR